MLSLNWRGITENLKQRLLILQTICCNSMLSIGLKNYLFNGACVITV
ncbi:unnamed protein product [Acanthoscelides obtectus]|uniref:Uncharacterized protein n=1 Tax=Acanthoscelides obtectus TaxID=200917 RepID=A0A9P0PDP5_ACAOB|nr:unnamed protein product [Acanthoscelides obtectus]CAK1677366.1 hypothetical protein AOBTE_LOCUS31274 [Acanthoscelides obtectus]